MVQYDLVVAEVVGSVESEVLRHVLLVQTERYTSFEDHVQLREDLAFPHDGLVGNKHPAVQAGSKQADELFPGRLVFVLEERPAEVVQEGLLEEHVNESEAEAGLELVQEVKVINQLLVVKPDGLADVDFDLLVEHTRQLLAHAGVVQSHQPHVHILQTGLLLVLVVRPHKDLVDEAHHDGEDQNAHELHAHGKAVLRGSVSLDVSVPHSGQGSHHPVNRGYIFELGLLVSANAIVWV